MQTTLSLYEFTDTRLEMLQAQVSPDTLTFCNPQAHDILLYFKALLLVLLSARGKVQHFDFYLEKYNLSHNC